MAASGFHLFFSKMQNQVLIASSARFAPLPFHESEKWLLAVLDRREATRVAQTRLGLAAYQQLNQLVISATASQVKGCELLRHSAVCDVRI